MPLPKNYQELRVDRKKAFLLGAWRCASDKEGKVSNIQRKIVKKKYLQTTNFFNAVRASWAVLPSSVSDYERLLIRRPFPRNALELRRFRRMAFLLGYKKCSERLVNYILLHIRNSFFSGYSVLLHS